jgi:GT2 family glycosyltransferase
MLDLSIITVTYQSEKQIESLIRSVRLGCQKISYEHIIVDNGSFDHTVPLIHSSGSPVVCLPQAKNLGFSAANILGYRQSKGRYLLFLNPDMEVEECGVDRMVDWIHGRKDVGIAGCRLLDQEGRYNAEATPRRFPKLHEQFILLLKLQKMFPKALNRYFYKDMDFTKEQAVDSVRGSFMLMRREFIDAVGWPFDPLYFIWFEDVDICREAWKHGFSVFYTPLVTCKDAIGQSFKQRDRRWRFRQYSESLLRYLKKWEPFYVWCWVPLLYRPLAAVIGSKWFERTKRLFSRQMTIREQP